MVLLICLLILLAAVFYYLYYETFYSPHKDQGEKLSIHPGSVYYPFRDRITESFQVLSSFSYEDCFTKSFDGLLLHARYLKGTPGMPLVICCHGYRSAAFKDFCGGGPVLHEKGFSLLLIDERAHGQSEGHTISFGVNERQDVLSWISYVNEHCGAETGIFLYGISMGAATVLMASELSLPENVKGILADCGYSSPQAIIRKVCTDRHVPVAMAPLIFLSAKVFGHFDPAASEAVKAVRRSPVPIVILHGLSDDFVPHFMGDEIKNSAPEKISLYKFPDAGHALCFMVDTERYIGIVDSFIASCLK